MSAEQLTAAGSIASALILAIATIAALVQLRHLRLANQLEGFLALFDRFNAPEMIEARNFCLAADFGDAAAISKMVDEGLDHRILMVGNYFQELGGLIRARVLDRDLLVPIYYAAPQMWEKLAPFARALRKSRGAPVWLDFEYAAWASQQRPISKLIARAFPSRFLSDAGYTRTERPW